MPLRLRLTFLYSLMLGGVLLLLNALVYGLVSITLLYQVDAALSQQARQLVDGLQVTADNQFDPRSVTYFVPTENLIFQVWGEDQNLKLARPAALQTPLDASTLTTTENHFHSTQVLNVPLRVLSVPLKSEKGPVGTLQVAMNLTLVEMTRRTLAWVIVAISFVAIVASGLAAWLFTGRALAPLAAVTRHATQITHADDLHRRIPYDGPPGDEVGTLIQAFNDTLERLENLFQVQRRFLADVSHELRTPLTVIKGNVGLIRQLGSIDTESLDSIENEVNRLTRLVGDVLMLAQAESGHLPLALAPVELDTVLLEVFAQASLLAKDRVEMRIEEIDQVLVEGDRDRLKQVMLNLVGNAVTYSTAGGVVSLSLRKTNHEAQLIIEDNGPGIAAEDLPFIFERFYRGEKSRKRSPGSGFGLGLSIAYWIVRHHNGRIEVQSEEGKGTRFTVWLPFEQSITSSMTDEFAPPKQNTQ